MRSNGSFSLIEKLTEDHEFFRNVVNSLTEEQVTKHIINSEWNVKDIVAHLAGWNWEYAKEMDRVLANKPTWQKLYDKKERTNLMTRQ